MVKRSLSVKSLLFVFSQNFQNQLDGYDFPVYSTESCPRNQSEWNKRSSAINCTNDNGYMCIPNDDRTQLLEFCYIYPRILITKGNEDPVTLSHFFI